MVVRGAMSGCERSYIVVYNNNMSGCEESVSDRESVRVRECVSGVYY